MEVHEETLISGHCYWHLSGLEKLKSICWAEIEDVSKHEDVKLAMVKSMKPQWEHICQQFRARRMKELLIINEHIQN